MKNLGYYNGKYDEIENMVIPMNDRASYFGDGVYDATYSRNYIIWNLQEHLDRLYNSARLLEGCHHRHFPGKLERHRLASPGGGSSVRGRRRSETFAAVRSRNHRSAGKLQSDYVGEFDGQNGNPAI